MEPDSNCEINEEEQSRKRKNPFRSQKQKEEKERRQKKKARLIVRNLSYKATEEDIRKHFSQWGELEDVNLLKRPDGKLVGCVFVQYATINQATKAILMGNNSEIRGRAVFVDWALGKDEYLTKKKQTEPPEKKSKIELNDNDENKPENGSFEESFSLDKSSKEHIKESDEESASIKSEESDSEGSNGEGSNNDDSDEDSNVSGADDINNDNDDDDSDEDKKDLKTKLNLNKMQKEKHISNDVQEGCTVFIKNVPFDAEDAELRKVCRKYGPLWYAIINRESVSGHSKGTAFVKFKTKESADFCLQAGTEFKLMEEVLDPHPALSKDEIHHKKNEKLNHDESKDSRNLYLAREGLIMANSSAAVGVSASDMNKRHKLEQVKAQVLKNLNRFISRNRLSIHNLPLNYDNEKLKQMAITYTSYKPHECRVMRENKITPEHPQGKSKGFAFLSFNTHKEALTALRKLNNNPSVFGPQHRPIVAFSIEDRAVHKIKEKREEKSKLNNPTYQDKLAKRKEERQAKASGKFKKTPMGPQSDNKEKLKKHIKALEKSRAEKLNHNNKTAKSEKTQADYVGTAAKPGTTLGFRSNKKIKEQSQDHLKRVKATKRKERQHKIRQEHLKERKSIDRPKPGRKVERDDLKQLVNKYKRMIDSKANAGSTAFNVSNGTMEKKSKKPKRTKWFQE